jgi:Cys-rich four helix bundle protein (predicted Tat secretion target)
MDRRDFVLGGGLSLAAAAAVAEHQHGAAPAADNALAHAASHCVQAADACLAHCLEMLGQGDKPLAACARSVTALRSVCDTLALLAAQPSPLLARYAAVAKQFCDDCEAECRKHADKHAVCKACAEACVDCAKECAKIAA